MKKLVLIRGLGRDSRHWGPLLEELKQALPQLEILCLDLLGFGSKAEKKTPLDISEMTEDLLSELPKDPVHIIGLSLGGMVVMDLVDRYPDRVDKYIIMNSSLKSLSPPWERFKFNLIAPTLKQLIYSTPEDIEKLIIDTVFSDPTSDKAEALDLWTEIQVQSPISKIAFLRQLYAASRYTGPKKLRATGLILTGEKDKLVSSNCSLRIAEHYNLELRVNPKSGHDPLDAPVWFVDKVSGFFS